MTGGMPVAVFAACATTTRETFWISDCISGTLERTMMAPVSPGASTKVAFDVCGSKIFGSPMVEAGVNTGSEILAKVTYSPWNSSWQPFCCGVTYCLARIS